MPLKTPYPVLSPYLYVGIVLVLTAVRILALFFSPLELGGDEAQYWSWSLTPDFGYFSKPPLIAWVIGLSTSLFGHAEWAVRIAAPLLHALAAFFLWSAGQVLAPGKSVGALAGLVYILMPGVWFSSGIITTDALLLPAIAGGLAAYFAILRKPSLPTAALLGLAIGLGFLAKYAMIYFCLGIGAVGLFDKATRRFLFSRYGALAGLVAFALVLPNIFWNANHHFATLSHTAQNANWQNIRFNPVSLLKFWGGQLGLFGILAIPAFLFAGGWALGKTAPQNARRLLVFAALPLLVVSIQALINRANANWAVSAYLPASLLLALWAQHLRPAPAKRVMGAVLTVNFMTGTAFAMLAMSPTLTARMGAHNAFKRVHGWRETAQIIYARAGQGTFDALLFDNRLFYYAVQYYGRDMDLPDMYIWPQDAAPHSHIELMNPINPDQAGHILVINARPEFTLRMAQDFKIFTPISASCVGLGGNKKRCFRLYDTQGFAPLARDAAYLQKWAR